MDSVEIFYNIIKQNIPVECDAQSYLICSKDFAVLMLLARLIVEKDCGGKFKSPDVKIFPQKDMQGLPGSLNSLPLALLDGADSKLTVSDIEEITTTAAITPLELKFKYYILKNGETLNDASSNKLLKTLEEPPKATKIIILSANEYSVLPTVRSRCRIINPAPLSLDVLDEAADMVYKDSPYLYKAKRLSNGSITRLIKAAEGMYEDIEQLVFDILSNMKNSRNQALYSQMLLKRKDEIIDIVDMLELVLSDVLLMQAGCDIRLDYKADEVSKIARQYQTSTIIRLQPVIDKTRHRLKFFGNYTSIIDELLFSLLETRQRCQL